MKRISVAFLAFLVHSSAAIVVPWDDVIKLTEIPGQGIYTYGFIVQVVDEY